MAGMEVVVRPVVFPDIRPTPKRTLPPPADPTQGFCEIHGNGISIVTLPYSFSASSSMSKPTEIERRVDTARVYQQEDSGKINKKNFIDLEVANRIKFNAGKLPIAGMPVADPLGGTKAYTEVYADHIETRYYKPVQEKENVVIIERSRILSKDRPDPVGP